MQRLLSRPWNHSAEYLDKTGGIWEEVEPQVYDMVLPEGTSYQAVAVTLEWFG